jgi:hypothetical protein
MLATQLISAMIDLSSVAESLVAARGRFGFLPTLRPYKRLGQDHSRSFRLRHRAVPAAQSIRAQLQNLLTIEIL